MRLLKIGRDGSCDIVLNSNAVSSLHAEITILNSGDILLEDKGSRNGTYVMNQQVQPGKSVNIVRGDAVRFADVELNWSKVPMPEDNTAYKAVYGIGSNFQNEIQLSGATVSRFHATIKQGKDGKVYIIDHSKNGTTVDGIKISPNTPYQIKKKNAIVCGGVPVSTTHPVLANIWPKSVGKLVAAIAAAVVLIAGIGIGAYTWPWGDGVTIPDSEIYNRYQSSVVMLQGVYHYKVTIGDLDPASVGLPTEVLPTENGYKLAQNLTTSEIIELCSSYTGTGFFISNDGKIITNLHIAKPWLFDDTCEKLESTFRNALAQKAQNTDFVRNTYGVSASTLSAYVSQVKVEGVLDYVLLVPQGKYFDSENAIKCRLLSAGDNDPNKDVALLQSNRGELPAGCTFVNVQDSMNVDETLLKVGAHVVTLGFPFGNSLQHLDETKGLQIFSHGGHITQESSEYEFNYDAATAGGASGSPVFNDHGELIGVHHAGVTAKQGFNYGIKAKYVKELLEKPYRP